MVTPAYTVTRARNPPSLPFGWAAITVVLGMIVFGVGVSFPVSRWGSARVRRAVNVAAAALSIFYAAYLFLGFEGVNLLPFAPA